MKEQQKMTSSEKNDLNTVPFKTRVRPYLIVAPALIITIGIMIPFVMAIYFSLTNYSFRMPTFKFIGLKNWIIILKSSTYWHAVWVTLRYAFFATVVEMLLGLGVAILLNNNNNRFTKILKVVLVFPLMIAPVIATIVW
ncbi:MAG: sugar ABC transporter permease, partial [Lachnospiraceae bacterium]